MEFQVSARKYRPGTFADVIGQPHVVQTLVNAISTQRLAHAYLFSGTRGVGKTTVARILAKALNCERGPTPTPCDTCPNCLEIAQGTSVDVIEIDGASNTGVDDVREIRENVKFAPFRGHYRVYIIDEVHMLSTSAFNALLKTLEEPPAHVVFIFATTEIHKIPATILSRCQHYNFRRIPRTEIIQRLRHVATQDGIAVEDRSLASIARAGEGSMRDALSLLDQAVAFSGKTLRQADLETLLGAVPQEHVRAMVSAVVAQDSPAAVRVVAHLLDQGHELRPYCADLVEHLRDLLVAAVVPASQNMRELQGLIDLPEEELRQLAADAKAFTIEQLHDLFRIFSQAEDALRTSTHPQFALEVAAVRATRLMGSTPQPPTVPAPPVPSAPATRRPDAPQQAPPRAPTAPVRTESNHPLPPAQPAGNSVKRPAAEPAKPFAKPGTREASRPATGIAPPAAKASAPHPSDAASKPVEPASSPPAPLCETPSPLQLDWEQVLERVETAQPSIAPFLAMGTLLETTGTRLTLGYPKTATVALARIQNEETLRRLEQICAEIAGRPVRLHVTELADGQPASRSMAQARAEKERDKQQALLKKTQSHPFVKQALELFGGELVAVRETVPQKETP